MNHGLIESLLKRRAPRVLCLALALVAFTAGNVWAQRCPLVVEPTERELTLETRRLDKLPSMDALFAALEFHDQCRSIELLGTYLAKHAAKNTRLRVTAFLVMILGRRTERQGPPSDSEMKLAAFQAGKLAEAEQQAVLAYAARKLSTTPETEALLAFAADTMPVAVEQRLANVAPQGVPAGQWAPPGDQPIPMYIGNEAHKLIAAHYAAAHKTEDVRLNNIPISKLLRLLARSGIDVIDDKLGERDLLKRPDITNLTTLELYEIKPAGAESVAASFAAAYVAIFTTAGVPMKLGATDAAGVEGVVPAPAGHYRFYSPLPGVIVYQYRRGGFVPARIPVRAVAASPAPVAAKSSLWDKAAAATGLTGWGLVTYLVISEGTRVFPPRNLIPLP